MQALGGTEAWNKTRYLRFDFAVDRDGKTVMRRAHTWDKWTGRYRLEATTREGDPYLVLLNIGSKDGRAWLKGSELQGDEARKYLEQGYAAWVNDTYWLLMPYKMKDPGVALALDGEATKGGETWDKLRLTFDNVGLTPKDKYWAYVSRKTGLVDRWDYVLKGESKPPTTFTWQNWKKYGTVSSPTTAQPRGRHAHPLPGPGSARLAPGRPLHGTLSESSPTRPGTSDSVHAVVAATPRSRPPTL